MKCFENFKICKKCKEGFLLSSLGQCISKGNKPSSSTEENGENGEEDQDKKNKFMKITKKRFFYKNKGVLIEFSGAFSEKYIQDFPKNFVVEVKTKDAELIQITKLDLKLRSLQLFLNLEKKVEDGIFYIEIKANSRILQETEQNPQKMPELIKIQNIYFEPSSIDKSLIELSDSLSSLLTENLIPFFLYLGVPLFIFNLIFIAEGFSIFFYTFQIFSFMRKLKYINIDFGPISENFFDKIQKSVEIKKKKLYFENKIEYEGKFSYSDHDFWAGSSFISVQICLFVFSQILTKISKFFLNKKFSKWKMIFCRLSKTFHYIVFNLTLIDISFSSVYTMTSFFRLKEDKSQKIFDLILASFTLMLMSYEIMEICLLITSTDFSNYFRLLRLQKAMKETPRRKEGSKTNKLGGNQNDSVAQSFVSQDNSVLSLNRSTYLKTGREWKLDTLLSIISCHIKVDFIYGVNTCLVWFDWENGGIKWKKKEKDKLESSMVISQGNGIGRESTNINGGNSVNQSLESEVFSSSSSSDESSEDEEEKKKNQKKKRDRPLSQKLVNFFHFLRYIFYVSMIPLVKFNPAILAFVLIILELSCILFNLTIYYQNSCFVSRTFSFTRLLPYLCFSIFYYCCIHLGFQQKDYLYNEFTMTDSRLLEDTEEIFGNENPVVKPVSKNFQLVIVWVIFFSICFEMAYLLLHCIFSVLVALGVFFKFCCPKKKIAKVGVQKPSRRPQQRRRHGRRGLRNRLAAGGNPNSFFERSLLFGRSVFFKAPRETKDGQRLRGSQSWVDNILNMKLNFLVYSNEKWKRRWQREKKAVRQQIEEERERRRGDLNYIGNGLSLKKKENEEQKKEEGGILQESIILENNCFDSFREDENPDIRKDSLFSESFIEEKPALVEKEILRKRKDSILKKESVKKFVKEEIMEKKKIDEKIEKKDVIQKKEEIKENVLAEEKKNENQKKKGKGKKRKRKRKKKNENREKEEPMKKKRGRKGKLGKMKIPEKAKTKLAESGIYFDDDKKSPTNLKNEKEELAFYKSIIQEEDDEEKDEWNFEKKAEEGEQVMKEGGMELEEAVKVESMVFDF